MNQVIPLHDDALPEHLRGRYQLQDCSMTLAEGLEEYFRVNPGLDDPREIEDPRAAHYFTCHDTCHVIFGTHTGDLDEGCNDTYTVFGVDLPWWQYIGGYLATEQSKSITMYYLKWETLRTIWNSILLIPAVWRLARAMKRKWPWEPTEEMYQRPINELRQEYGIQVLHPQALLDARS